MTVNAPLLNELFRAFHIRRWNDRLRPMELIETDKHALKLILAYCFGRYEEARGNTVDWLEIIRSGIYELLRRIVISDIKSPIFNEIKKNAAVFEKLNTYVFKELGPIIEDDNIREELRTFLFSHSEPKTLSGRIVDAAHAYSSYLEFVIIRNVNPYGYQNIKIESEMLRGINAYADLDGIRRLTDRRTIHNFIDLCHQLRFQVRWAQTPRVPHTSVLGHSLFVAVTAHFFVSELRACPKRLYNAFFGGLFHDLPEAVTRDIISPVKNSSEELDEMIKSLERELSDKEIFPHVDAFMVPELKYFTREEFADKIIDSDGNPCYGVTFDELNTKYNSDTFSPYDGKIIRAADHLSTFLEAWHSCASGIKSEELKSSYEKIKSRYEGVKFGPIDLDKVYAGYSDSCACKSGS